MIAIVLNGCVHFVFEAIHAEASSWSMSSISDNYSEAVNDPDRTDVRAIARGQLVVGLFIVIYLEALLLPALEDNVLELFDCVSGVSSLTIASYLVVYFSCRWKSSKHLVHCLEDPLLKFFTDVIVELRELDASTFFKVSNSFGTDLQDFIIVGCLMFV